MAAAAATTTTTATLHRAPITFRLSSLRSNSINPLNLSSSSRLTLSKLTIKITNKPRRRDGGAGGGCSGGATMMTDSAAGNYATALAEVARSNKTLDTTAIDVEKIEKLFSDESVFKFFVSPIVTLDQKLELIDDLISSKNLQLHVCNFLKILIERNRIDLIKEIANEFEIVYNKFTATELAIVTSVVQLDRRHLAQIAKQVQRLTGGEKVRIKTAIDESLVAGFTIRYGSSQSKMIDMSVKKQLEDIAAMLEIEDVPIRF